MAEEQAQTLNSLENISQISDADEKSQALIEYLNALPQAEPLADASELFSQVSDALLKGNDSETKSDLLKASAVLFSEAKAEATQAFFSKVYEKLPETGFEKALIDYHAGYFYLRSQNTEKAHEFFENSVQLFKELEMPIYQADSLHALANCLSAEKNYDAATDLYESAAQMFIAAGAADRARKCFLNTRIVFREASNYKYYIKHCKSRLKEYKAKPEAAYFLFELAWAYKEYGNPKKEQKYLLQAIEAKEAAGIKAELGFAYSLLADFYDEKAEDEKALDAYLRAAELMLEMKEYDVMGPVVNFLNESEAEMNEAQSSRYERISEQMKALQISLE